MTDLVFTILVVIGSIIGVIVLGFFALLAIAMNAYYHTEMGEQELKKLKTKNKK